MSIELNCWGFIPSCTGSGELVQVTEEVYLIIKDGQFTDGAHPGFVSATVSGAYKQCDACYNYIFEPTSALPAGVASLAQCDILSVVCDPAGSGVPCCEAPMLTLVVGDQTISLNYGATLNLTSDTLSLLLSGSADNATVQLEGVATSLGTESVITGTGGGVVIPAI